ncbi:MULTISPECIES: hypothetical protein [unclassified Mesorhizobium]|uniref:hypothetical protein n=1 Tax=unclassified Mesorhizobium TaxID=325217 RepID=UPI0003D02650|nr:MULTISPECIES: hypothetical protein [unclassified Mesorhizobium]ESZ18421.1 hypothetical protein X737_18930 [Mesorhizobium sp. L48C026A00]RWN51307.1 MAG: hypothetical protein EOR98_27255 [Mesorhizobium sp.]RWN72870.1 MAG: hypothetical protein EOS02_26185 [Mesorhizobium sp.]RWN72939.1 MAG: hypothetical protein EOS01_27355 [Mesorhizobium sp.]RWN84391.1 MAG: hypothetical protein EOS04_25325 [Mesorhizobium sp.]
MASNENGYLGGMMVSYPFGTLSLQQSMTASGHQCWWPRMSAIGQKNGLMKVGLGSGHDDAHTNLNVRS